MKLHKKMIIGSVLASLMLIGIAPALRAESQVAEPGELGITVDPNASGTKISGVLSFSYDYEKGTDRANACPDDQFVRSMFAVATMRKGFGIFPVSSHYAEANKRLAEIRELEIKTGKILIGVPEGILPLEDCFDRGEKQVFFFKYLIEVVLLPRVFGCTVGSCPTYAIKSLKNFVTTLGIGGGSMELELAVR